MSFDWGSFIGGVLGGGLSGVITLSAAFRIANGQASAQESSARTHLEMLLQKARSIPSPASGFPAFAQAHDSAVELAGVVREQALLARDEKTIRVAHTLFIGLDTLTRARRGLTATLGGFGDNAGGQATKDMDSALGLFQTLALPPR
jgi:hypothetical protein